MVTEILDRLNHRGAAIATRLRGIHPKHLSAAPWHHWYLSYLEPGDVVLDLGCANGVHANAAAAKVGHVTGIDRDLNSLDIARRGGARNATFLSGDITRGLPYDNATFDAVMCLDVIEHLEPRQRVLREIARVLKPDGRLLISAPNRGTAWRRRLLHSGLNAYSDPDHKVEYTLDEFVAELREGGFVAQIMEPVVYDTPWSGVIDLVGGISLTAYRRLIEWKRRRALQRPEDSIGFRVVALRVGEGAR